MRTRRIGLGVLTLALLDGAPALAQQPSPEPAPAEQPTTTPPEPGNPEGPVHDEAAIAASMQELQMSPDELAALGLNVTQPAIDFNLRISGFADIGFGTMIGPKDAGPRASGSNPPRSTFYVGNFNIYVAKQITPSVSMMSEVRLSFLPNGSSAFGLQEPTSTTAFDYTDFGRPTRWGGIILQRIYLEWTAHPLLSLRAGQFLTPYGVWNVDHGSPVFIPVRRPWSIGVGWIPEKQTGLELYGRASVSRNHTVGYHLTLSNGTGPVSEYQDLDENKAIGGRLYWEFRGLGRLRVGASAYYGRDTNTRFRWVRRPEGDTRTSEDLRSQSDILSWAADLTWQIGGLHLQTEWLTNQRAYTDKGRRPQSLLAGTTIVPSDLFSWGGYSLIGYRFSFLGVMPFFMSERVNGDLLFLELKIYTLQFGLNVRPTEALVFKASYDRVRFQGTLDAEMHTVMTQAAWAF